MIVQATREFDGGHENIDVSIDPFNILCELSQDWRTSIGVERNSPLMGGYWMRGFIDYSAGNKQEVGYERIRLATHDEIIRFEAIKNVTELTATFY